MVVTFVGFEGNATGFQTEEAAMRVGKTHGTLVHFRDRAGFHLIELLVVLSTVSLLLALLVPAVQESRDKARVTRCAANLRQLAFATQSYVASCNAFPAAIAVPSVDLQRQYSVFSQILGPLGEAQLFNGINFEAGLQDFYIFNNNARYKTFLAMNSTSLGTSLETLLCPADTEPQLSGTTAGCNYRATLGAEYVSSVDGSNRASFFSYRASPWGDSVTAPDGSTRGPFSNGELVTPATIKDGLANTVIFSEKLRGDPNRKDFDPRTDMLVGRLQHYWDGGRNRSFCNGVPGSGDRSYFTTAGATWLVGALSQTCYNHFDTPNSEDPDCAIMRNYNPIRGRMAAQSNHAYGVQAAMADGSVRFVAETIDRRAWRALGTRARHDGGEGF
jgi:type II secretory pathway pseudopilin PulG